MSAQLTVISNNHVEIGKPQLDIDTKYPAPAKVGAIIQNGGNIEISALKVTLNAGFKVEAGGKLTITTN